MPWLRHFALFLVFVAALLKPATAGAFVSAPAAGSQARVGAFELVAATLVGPASGATCGLHEGIGAAYGENASGYRFAAGGVARGGAGVVRVGQAGEAAVRSVADIGPKVAIDVAGRTRIPDGLTSTVLSEVKNVGSLSYTQQLRDFAAHASANGLRFDLWVRPTTQLSGPLAQEVANGAINLRYIP
jgi:hypothetical protein